MPKLPARKRFAATIHGPAELLGLLVGARAVAAVKAPHVMPGTEG